MNTIPRSAAAHPRLAAATLAMLIATLGTPAQAAPKTQGPFSDMKADLPILPVDYATQGYHTALAGPQGVITLDFVQCHPQKFSLPPDSPYRLMQGLAYVTSKGGSLTKGNLLVTTIYGQDLNPDGTDPILTGYTASAPELSFDHETLIGKSGRVYTPSTSEVVTLADLPHRLGSGFDLSAFQGDPSSVVYLFQTTMPAKDSGTPGKGVMLTEDFSGAFHVGPKDPGGAFDTGDLSGTNFRVTSGNVDILGVLNGTNGTCVANPSGNCLDLIGDTGAGAIQSLAGYPLDPAYTYTIQFMADTGGIHGAPNMDFSVSLGGFSQTVTAMTKFRQFDLTYTPASAEPNASLNFASITNWDGIHGPVISNITLCAHKIGTKNLRCTPPKS